MNEAETRAEHIDPALKALAALLQGRFAAALHGFQKLERQQQ